MSELTDQRIAELRARIEASAREVYQEYARIAGHALVTTEDEYVQMVLGGEVNETKEAPAQ